MMRMWPSLFAVLISASASGQELQFRGERPTEVLTTARADVRQLLAREPAATYEPDVRAGKPVKCWIHWQGVRLRTDHALSADPRPLRVRDATTQELGPPSEDVPALEHTFHIGDVYQGADGTWILLCDAHPRTGLRALDWYGWVRREECLFYVDRSPEALKDPKTSIHRKCMLVNRVDQSSAKPGAALESTAFYGRPDRLTEPLGTRRFFEIFFIYDETPEAFYIATEPHLLGVRENARSRSNVLLGWVPRDLVFQWNTREAVEFNKHDIARREMPALIFHTREQLEQYLLKPRRVPSVEELRKITPPVLVASENMDNKQLLPYDAPRFPVLDGSEVEGGLNVSGTRIYRVGIIGDVIGQSGEVVLPKEELLRLQREAEKYLQAVRSVEVAFLIDGTYSMKEWFGMVRKAVRNMMGQLNQIDTDIQPDQVRFSVSFYRTKNEGKDALELNGFTNALDAEEVLDHAAAIGGRGETQLFRGIEQAVTQLGFGEATTRILVVIGDDGNAPGDISSTAAKVAQAVQNLGEELPVGFFAVAVGNPESEGHGRFLAQTQQVSAALFAEQERRLLKRLGKSTLPPEMARSLRELTGQTLVSSDPDQIVTAISQRFQLAVEEAQFRLERINRIASGEERYNPRDFGQEPKPANSQPAVTNGHRLVWEQQILDLAERKFSGLLDGRQGVQIFEEGWVAERHPEEAIPAGESLPPACIRHVVYIRRSEFDRFKGFLQAVLDSQNVKTEAAWKQALERYSGEKNLTGKSPEDLMQMHWGLKASQGLLQLTFDEIGNLTPTQRYNMIGELKLKLLRMEDTWNEVTAAYRREDGQEIHWDRTHRGERLVWWPRQTVGVSGGDEIEQRAWVEREVLP